MRPTFALLILGIAACSKADGAPEGAGGGAEGGGPPAMPVEVVTASADTVVDAILATGQIEAINSVELRPDIEGRIAAILVREGSTVSKGQPLFQVDDAELKAEVARAEAERDLARQSLTRQSARQFLGRQSPGTGASPDLVFLVGDVAYYERFGFVPATPHGFVMPGERRPDRLQVFALKNDVLGLVAGDLLRQCETRVPAAASVARMPAILAPARLA